MSIKLHNPTILEEAIAHADLTDMPDVTGTNSDHDARYYTETEIDTLLTSYVPYTAEGVDYLGFEIVDSLPSPAIADKIVRLTTDNCLYYGKTI